MLDTFLSGGWTVKLWGDEESFGNNHMIFWKKKKPSKKCGMDHLI